jgi:hypothetical protein
VAIEFLAGVDKMKSRLQKLIMSREPVALSFVLFFIVFWGCGIIESGESLRPIEGKINFRVEEGYESYNSVSEPKVMLTMSTEKIYGCFNYTIQSRISILGNIILVDVSGIFMPEVCFTALGPARSRSVLPISPGQYSLRFSWNGKKDRYALTLTDSSIAIAQQEANFTNPTADLFWRYPQSSFAYLCGALVETSWICDDFLDTLRSEISLEEFRFPEFGVIPYADSSNGHYYNMPAKYFIYNSEEDFDKAGDLLKAYAKRVTKNYSGVGLSLINWKNLQYLSWLYD